jgi:UDP-N-acetylmuramoyl-tripeptide--D-alanyl-D-alanine ligase
VVVLNVDDERLSGLAERLEREGKQVVRASGADPHADVAVIAGGGALELHVAGRLVGAAPVATGEQPPALSNAACAAAVAIELGTPPGEIPARLAGLPSPPNRLQRHLAEGGYVVLDDTFNSNPAGARMAIRRLGTEAPEGRRVLVTPGMVELGRTQAEENARLAAEASALVTDLVAVARTNRRALVEGAERSSPGTGGGAGQSGAEVHVVDVLPQAVEWVRRHLGPGDAVLYENDLPDHFP